MKKSEKWLIAMLWVSSLGCMTDAPQPHTIVPFDLKNGNLVVFKGTIGEIQNLNFVIDTGTTKTVMAEDLAKVLKLKGQSNKVISFDRKLEVKEVKLPVVKIGELRFEGQLAQVGDLEFPDLAESVRIDALIGLNLLRETSLAIDYADRTLVFGPIEHSRPTIAFYNKLPFVPVSLHVRGKRLNLFLDTGATDLVLFSHSADGRVPFRRTGETSRWRTAGGNRSLEKILLSDVRLGPIEWKELPGHLLNGFSPIKQLDGVLGIMSLGLKRLNLDFQNSLISFEK